MHEKWSYPLHSDESSDDESIETPISLGIFPGLEVVVDQASQKRPSIVIYSEWSRLNHSVLPSQRNLPKLGNMHQKKHGRVSRK